jgi:hypothetical protein
MVAHLLRQKHAVVMAASTVDEALRQLDIRLPDVLLSDVENAETRRVRAHPDDVCGFSGKGRHHCPNRYSRFEDRAKSLLAGFDAHL